MNLYEHLERVAAQRPDQVAVYAPDRGAGDPGVAHHSLTMAQLDARAGKLAAGLVDLGIGAGDRVVLMVPVSLDLYVVVAALFRLAAVPVLMDPWMGVARMADCIRRTQPRLFLGVPLAHALFLWRPGLRRLRRVTVGGKPWMGRHSVEAMIDAGAPAPPVATLQDDAPGLITFTGGSTGRPKGVFRTHGLLQAQHEGTTRCMGMDAGEVHLQTFPNMILSNIASGVTSVVPWFRQGHAAEADPAALLRQVRRLGVAGMCGPPALLGRLARHCIETDQRMSGVRRVLMGGSAVGFEQVREMDRATRPGATAVLYGSSEAEPLASLEGRPEIDRAEGAMREGGGLCLGHPRPGLDMELRALPLGLHTAGMDEAALAVATLPPGHVGELIVRGRHVSRRYFGDPRAEADQKIRTTGGHVWHRLGDLGYLDEDGRIYVVGRVNDTVQRRGRSLYPLVVEPLIEQLPFVRRCGLVGHPRKGMNRSILAYEAEGRPARRRQRREREDTIRAECERIDVIIDQVVVVGEIPVDRRHNGKVERDELAAMCRRELGWPDRRTL